MEKERAKTIKERYESQTHVYDYGNDNQRFESNALKTK
jgi:hypothetical protein